MHHLEQKSPIIRSCTYETWQNSFSHILKNLTLNGQISFLVFLDRNIKKQTWFI